MQAIQFKNWTTEDFTWKFDGIPYTFKAGQTIYLEDFKANHFAKHLVDREMNKLSIVTDNPQRTELEAQCFPSAETITPLEALQINKIDEKKTKKVEKEFAGLSDK